MHSEKNEAAQALGRLGGLARRKWTPEQRSEAARKASHATKRYTRLTNQDYKAGEPDTK